MLTEGSVTTYAICLDCDRRSGRSLERGWWRVALWIAGPILALALVVILIELLAR